MKYKELFTPERAVFATIFAVDFPEQYKTIFGETIPQVYDVVAVLECGEKTLLNVITPDSYKEIVSAVITMNVDSWVKAANAMLAEYDAINPVKRSTTRTEQTNENETATDNTTDSRKAFNDTDFSPDSRGESDSEKTRSANRSTTETVAGIGESKDITETLRKEFAFRLDKWRKNIIFALINEITTQIYNNGS